MINKIKNMTSSDKMMVFGLLDLFLSFNVTMINLSFYQLTWVNYLAVFVMSFFFSVGLCSVAIAYIYKDAA